MSLTSFHVGDRLVGPSEPCFVIAEAGSNHDGSLGTALKLVDAAANAGADAVKFQLFRASELYPSNCGVVDLPSGREDFFELLTRLEMPWDWLDPLSKRSHERSIALLFSVFDTGALAAVARLDPPAFKVASPEMTHLPLLRELAALGRPIVLSTGMSTLGEIEESVGVLRASGATDIAVLHCVSAYPAPPTDCDLSVLPVLASAFGVVVGFSDHTLDPLAAPLVACAHGGSIVEKHFTLSRSSVGPDHPFAIEPDELAALVADLRALHAVDPAARPAAVRRQLGDETVDVLLGSPSKQVAASESLLAACDRRSLHAIAEIAEGEELGAHNIAILRGERNLRPGLHPRHWDQVAGARAVRAVPYGDGIVWDDVILRA